MESVVIPEGVTTIGYYAFVTDAQIYAEAESKPADWSDAWHNGSGTVYRYSESEPALNAEETAYDGSYWRYVDGEICVREYSVP